MFGEKQAHGELECKDNQTAEHEKCDRSNLSLLFKGREIGHSLLVLVCCEMLLTVGTSRLDLLYRKDGQ